MQRKFSQAQIRCRKKQTSTVELEQSILGEVNL